MPRPGRMNYLISYDIPSDPPGDRRRQRLAKHLEQFGIRIQYSIFECELNPGLLAQIIDRIEQTIDPKLDNVRIYTLCASCTEKVQNMGTLRTLEIQQDCVIY